MDYRRAREWVSGLGRLGMRLGLEVMRELLARLGDPQRGLRCVHVAGTNGKGSTVAIMGSVLEHAGFRVGYYTSPMVERPSERVRVGSEELGGRDFARLATRVRDAAEAMVAAGSPTPTEFEAVTAIGLLHFAERAVDVALLEVGLGGRLDATNAVDAPEVAVVCRIARDHEAVLGSTLAEIAAEKAGIVKPGSVVVSAPQEPEAAEVIRAAAAAAGDELVEVRARDVVPGPIDDAGQGFSLPGLPGLRLSLIGRHQLANAATAVAALRALSSRGLPVSEDDVRAGLASARWPGRLEVLSRDPLVLVDGAHNPDGAAALAEALRAWWPGRRFAMVMGALADKDYGAMVDAVAPLAGRVLCVDVPNPRTLPAHELARAWRDRGADAEACASVDEALDGLDAELARGASGCAFGSLYYIGKVRRRYLAAGGPR